jgi:DNA-binding IclR family transcriptional regulator
MRVAKGIRSIETGFRVLRALEVAPHALTLTEVAEASGLSMSSARFYLISLIRAGAVTQTSSGGRYRLGPAALRMGLAALSQNDVLQMARDRLEALRDATGETVFLSVWGEFGPVVVNRVDGNKMAPLGIRVGSHPTLLGSATGKAFVAFMPEAETRPLLKKQPLQRGRRGRPALVGTRLEDVVAEVRRSGMAFSSPGFLPGVQAIAAPVFGMEGVQCVITIMGHEGEFDARDEGLPAKRLLEMTRSVSRDAGCPGEPAARKATATDRARKVA